MAYANSSRSNFDASLLSVMLKSAVVHTASYFIFGMAAFFMFNYTEEFSSGALAGYFRPVSDQIVMLGPVFQPIRGALFGIVFYLLGDLLFTRNRGWLTMWVMLVIIGILSPFGAAPGSIEAAVYTQLSYPTLYDFNLVEVYGQAMVLAVGVYFWVRNPDNRWVLWGFSVIALAAILLPIAGVFLAPPVA